MEEKNSRIPVTLIASFIFILISAITFVGMWTMMNNAPDGLGGAGQDWAAIVIIIVIAIPACILSLITGIVALRQTKLAYLTVGPSALITLYVLYQYIALK